MAIDDNTSYELTGAQVKDLANKIKAKAADNTFVGATSAAPGSKGLVPQPQAGDQEKVLHGDGSWKDTTAKLVEMSYGESKAWAKFIAAYNAGSIVYCRASSNSNPATGAQGRKAFMAYVNNATAPTEVEFQYVRSMSTKTDSQQGDQVFVYKLTNASGGTWTVTTRNMSPKINVSGPITKTFVTGANATVTIGANAMTGATSSAAGTAGVVPAPASGDQNKVLTGAGTWVDMAGSYSTSETATPFTWVDGKTIYKQTYRVPSGPSSGTATVYISVPSSIDQIINYEGFLASSILTVYIGTARANSGTSTGFWYERDNNQIALEAGTSDRSGFSGYVTIYYTKTS